MVLPGRGAERPTVLAPANCDRHSVTVTVPTVTVTTAVPTVTVGRTAVPTSDLCTGTLLHTGRTRLAV